MKEWLAWVAHEWNIDVLKDISTNVYCSWKKDRCVFTKFILVHIAYEKKIDALNERKINMNCRKISNWEARMRTTWDETIKHVENLENFFLCVMFHLLNWNPASFFGPVLIKKKRKLLILSGGWFVALRLIWPYSWKFSPSLLQILGWKTFEASSLSIQGPSSFGTTKYHDATDFPKNEFSF